MLGGSPVITGPGQRQAQAELRVVVGRACLDNPPEATDRVLVVLGIELGAAQRLKDAAGIWLGCGGPLKQLSGGRRAAASEQVKAASVERVSVIGCIVVRRAAVTATREIVGGWPGRLSARSGIPAPC